MLEASSHGLDQERLSGLAPMRAACFTGLGRDHGDYHAGRGDYLAAKLRLFTERLADDGIAVLCAGRDGSDEIARHLAAAKPGVRVLRYGGTAASGGEAGHRVASFAPEPGGASAEFVFQGPGAASGAPEQGALRCSLPFYAPFQAENLLAASLLASALAGRPAAELLAEAAATGVPQVPGRMERVLHSGASLLAGTEVLVDFAHTPEAVSASLCRLAERRDALAQGGKLVAVLGAGGERDVSKREPMGRAAARAADAVFVTDDNPRGEDPAAIRAAVVRGALAGGAQLAGSGQGQERAAAEGCHRRGAGCCGRAPRGAAPCADFAPPGRHPRRSRQGARGGARDRRGAPPLS